MTGNAQKQIFKAIGLAVAIFVLFGTYSFSMQEKVSPLSDYQYKKDFAQYDTIKKEADIQKRADLLLAFVKERPISRMLLYAATDYLDCVKPQVEKKDWAKAISMEEALLALVPSEKTVQDAGIPAGVEAFIKEQLVPTQKLMLQNLLGAYYQANNLQKASEAAEKLYAITQDKSVLPVLADVNLRLQNTDKFLEYGKKILAEIPMEQAYTIALQMAQVYIQKQDVASATDLFSKIMDVYGDKLPPGVQEAQWNATRAAAYGIIATGVYAKKDYPKAIELFDKVAKFDPKRDDAHYFMGMCKWQSKDQEGAIQAFAKCVVLNKQYAPKAKQYMEDLYKAQHSGSLDGLDQVLAKAKSELGM
jgi:tetratricopeptide (TPR) repeat protein